MRPGRNLVLSLLALAVAALFVPLVPELPWFLALALLLVLGAAAIEYLLLRRVLVLAERRPVIVLSLDEEETIPLLLTTSAARAVRMRVRQVWPRLMEQDSSTLDGVCQPGETLRLEFRIHTVRRGTEWLGAPHVAITFWGWAERILEVGDPVEVNVLPNLRAVGRLHQQLNQFILRGMGQRMAPRLGKGREFDRLREYVVGDDYRDIVWKATARHRKLIVREFRLDRSQDVLVCIDRGHRMAARTTRVTRVDHAVNAAVLVSYICNRMEDRVGMLSIGSEAEQGVKQGRGTSHLRQLTAFATSVKAEYIHTDFLALAAHLRRRLRSRTLVLIMTTLPEHDEEGTIVRAVRMLIPQHLPLMMVLSDPALEAAARSLPADKEELCRTLVARDVWIARRQISEELRRSGAWVVHTTPEDMGIDAVNSYLEIKRRQLL